LLANISELEVNFASNFIINFSGETYAVWFCNCFESSSDVHSVAIETGIVEDNITLVDANPELHLT
jgi:hypothetical protein